MIRHIALVTWKAQATAEQRAATIKRMRSLPEHIETIRCYSVEENVGPDAANFDLAIVGEFDDTASYEAYRDHPEHQALFRESTQPILEARAGIQITR